MTNQLILIKLMQRLDKLSSSDYGNVEQWMYLEAFNKAQISWVRRQLEGINQSRTGAEGSTRRIDDLQYILNTIDITMQNKGIYWVAPLPSDYLQWCRISANAVNTCCPPRPLIIFESIEADRDINLLDTGKQPSYEWTTTFTTVSSKEVNVYTNRKFDLEDTTLTYYKTPVNIEITGVTNPYTGTVSTTDVLCEAADNIIELFIDDATSILSRDIKDYQAAQFSQQSGDRNT